jgi:hypothetical protein
LRYTVPGTRWTSAGTPVSAVSQAVADVDGTVEESVQREADSHDCLATSEERPSTARTMTPRFADFRAPSSREGISAKDIGAL